MSFLDDFDAQIEENLDLKIPKKNNLVLVSCIYSENYFQIQGSRAQLQQRIHKAGLKTPFYHSAGQVTIA